MKMAVKNQAANSRSVMAILAELRQKETGQVQFLEPTPDIITYGPKDGKAYLRQNVVNNQFRQFDVGQQMVILFDSPDANRVIPVKYALKTDQAQTLTVTADEDNATLLYDTILEWRKKISPIKLPKDGALLREKIKNGGTFVVTANVDQLVAFQTAAYFYKNGLQFEINDANLIDSSYIDLEDTYIDVTAKPAKKNVLSIIAGYQIPQALRNFTSNIVPQIFEKGRQMNILLTGPSGSGKTSYPQALGEHFNLPVVTVNCQVATNPRQWFGKVHLNDNKTYFEKSHFAKMIEAGNCIVILDEINRVSPDDANSLLTLLDHNRKVHLEDVDVTIAVGNGVLFFATMNEGPGYTGTSRIDEALKNRYNLIFEFKKLNRKQEVALLKHKFSAFDTYDMEIAETILNIFDEIRKYVEKNEIDIDISTRPLLSIAEQVFVYSMPIAEAMMFGVANKLKIDELKKPVLETIGRYTAVSMAALTAE